MERTRMWITTHPLYEWDATMWLMSTTEPEREFATIQQRHDGFYVGTISTTQKKYVNNDVFELMSTLLMASFNDPGMEVL